MPSQLPKWSVRPFNMSTEELPVGEAVKNYPKSRGARGPHREFLPIVEAVRRAASGQGDTVLTFDAAGLGEDLASADVKRAYDAAVRYIKRMGASDSVCCYVYTSPQAKRLVVTATR